MRISTDWSGRDAFWRRPFDGTPDSVSLKAICRTSLIKETADNQWEHHNPHMMIVVLDVKAPRVVARVVHAGEVKSHKGINLPGVNVSAPSITDKDRADAAFAVEQKLDYLALSFVRRAADIEELRALIPKSILAIAKIEKK